MEHSKRKPNHEDENAFEKELQSAMRYEGWLAPETVLEVLEAEKRISTQHIDRPDSFKDPRKLLEQKTTKQLTIRSSPIANIEVVDNLARAARQGRKISEEVEERMKRDRDSAENQIKEEK